MRDIKLYYFNKCLNFGDLLNEYIIKNLFNYNIIHSDIIDCEACFIGSILTPFLQIDTFYKNLKPLKIWGSGLMHTVNHKKKFIRDVEIYALRGKLSRKYLELYNHEKYKNVVLGDPGLLCSKVFTDKVKKEYEWGIIPHYIDKDNDNLKKLQLPNSIVLDICEQPETLIPNILKCKRIISSAMHGLIAADSFCIPNIRMILSNKIGGGDFKYNDYYSVFNIENHNKVDLQKINKPISELNFEYKITPQIIEKIQTDLIRSFPYA
jgi:hypothetical protein